MKKKPLRSAAKPQVLEYTGDVAAIRKNLKLSQAKFAALLEVDLSTLQNWEQGRRKPRGPAEILLKVAARRPDIMLKLLPTS